MIEYFKREKWCIFAISLIFILAIPFFWLRMALLTIDIGRELYIPWQMIKGHLLYKDIFIIFAPLSYQISAFSLKLLGDKLSSFYIFGLINSFLIVNLTYAIGREFLSKKLSLLITFFVMFTGVFAFHIFNFNMPYAYAMPYSLMFFLASFLALIKYLKSNGHEAKYVYISSLFCGAACVTKYEYILFAIFLVYIFCCFKPISVAQKIKSVLAFLTVPTLSYGTLLLQGVTFYDWYNNFLIVQKMATSSAMHHFYMVSGAFFSLSKFFQVLNTGVIFSLIVGFSIYYSLKFKKQKNKKSEIIIIILTWIFLFIYFMIYANFSFAFLSILNLLLLTIFFKRIYKNPPLFALMVSAFLISLKSFYSMELIAYGVISIGVLLVAIAAFFLSNILEYKKEIYLLLAKQIIEIILTCALVLMFGYQIWWLTHLNSPVYTPKGVIYTTKGAAAIHNDFINYLKQNTKTNDTLLVLPETPLVNYVMNLDSDNIHYTLMPADIDMFGEKQILDKFVKIKPDFFALSNRETSEYGKDYMCSYYASTICIMVYKNYKYQKTLKNGDYIINIYKRK
ncbi:MAG: glycosyltransferase family 39 protein [Candidatus Gastranaerophilales bacterium]|nr:glycosyltransferase family 39 protein [Candidatus Gastranaerophilales bacterium]